MTTSTSPHYDGQTFQQFMKAELAYYNHTVLASAYGESVATMNGNRRTWWVIATGGNLGTNIEVAVVTWCVDRGWFNYKENASFDFRNPKVPVSIRKKAVELGLQEDYWFPLEDEHAA